MLSEALKDKLIDRLYNLRMDHFDNDQIHQVIMYGYMGLNDMSDEELVDEYSNTIQNDDDEFLVELIMDLEFHKQLVV